MPLSKRTTIDPAVGQVTLAELIAALQSGDEAPSPAPRSDRSAVPGDVPTAGPTDDPSAGGDDGIAVAHDLFKVDPALNARLRAAGLNDRQIQLVYDIAEERLVPIVRDLNERFRSARDLDRLVERFGGEERWREVARQIKAWAERNLPPDAVRTLTSSHDGVVAIHRMMSGAEPGTLRAGAVPNGVDENDLRAMIRDPKYWRDRDPATVARVSDGFRRLYPSG